MKKPKTSKFLGKVNSDAKRQKTAGSSYGYLSLPKGVNVFSAEPGSRVKLDIIPYIVTDKLHPDRNVAQEIAVPGESWYKRPFKTHRNVGADKDTVVCLASFGKKCPICDYRAKKMKEGAEKEETDLMKPSLRNLYIVIPHGVKKFDDGVMYIWDISQYLFQNLLNDELEENNENAIFPDLEQGLTLSIRFDSKTIGTSQPFAEASRIDFDERKKQYEESLLDEAPNLDKILTELTYKELELKFFEREEEVEPEEEVQEEPAPRRRARPESEEEDPEPAPRRRARPEPEPEPEPEPAPRRRAKPEPEPEPEEEDFVDDGVICIACQGTGKNSRGKQCPICHGSGVRPEPEDVDPDAADPDDEPEPEPAPRRKTPAATEPAAKPGKNKCPYGHVFGKDCEKYKECDDCDLWDKCMEEQTSAKIR